MANSSHFPIEIFRQEFPILQQSVNGQPLVFLDSAASAQKPRSVTQAMSKATETAYANVHRGAYEFSQICTRDYEIARQKTQAFLKAQRPEEIIFTSNITAAMNLVAYSFGSAFLKPGDEIIVSMMEHHANFVPWFLACQRHKAILRVAPLTQDGELDMAKFADLLNSRTKLVALTHVSNVLGTINPIKEIIALVKSKAKQAYSLIDGAQAVAHLGVDVQDLDCDFYGLTAHKLYGPTGLGVLYGRYEVLEAMPPFLSGGDMIKHVSLTDISFAEPPARFEAGTPPILESYGLAAALDFIGGWTLPVLAAHEHSLVSKAMTGLQKIEGIRIWGPPAPKPRAPVVAFSLEGVHAHDLAVVLNEMGIAVRSGHHCAEPLHQDLGISGTVRASFAAYNQMSDVEALLDGIRKAKRILQ